MLGLDLLRRWLRRDERMSAAWLDAHRLPAEPFEGGHWTFPVDKDLNEDGWFNRIRERQRRPAGRRPFTT